MSQTVFHTHTHTHTIAEMIVYEGHRKAAVNHGVEITRSFVKCNFQQKPFLVFEKQELLLLMRPIIISRQQTATVNVTAVYN
jgi:hypothetical protein